MQISMHRHGKAGHHVSRQSDTNAQTGHMLVHPRTDGQGQGTPVTSRFKQIQASALQRPSKAGPSLSQTLPGVPTCIHVNIRVQEPQQQLEQTRSLHIYACPLPGPSLVPVYGALALPRHPVPAVTSLGS